MGYRSYAESNKLDLRSNNLNPTQGFQWAKMAGNGQVPEESQTRPPSRGVSGAVDSEQTPKSSPVSKQRRSLIPNSRLKSSSTDTAGPLKQSTSRAKSPTPKPARSASQTGLLSFPQLRPYQLPVLTSLAVDDLTVSAPQLGKTLTAGLWLFGRAYMHGPDLRPCWWTAPTYLQARHGFNMLVDFARQTGLYEGHTATPPLELRCQGMPIIEARSWERPENMRGPTVLYGVSDEFGEMTPAAYSAISSRRAETITHGLGHWRWIGNVGGIGGTAEKLWNMAEDGAAGFAYRRWTWNDRGEAHTCACGNGAEIPIEYKFAADHKPACARGIYLAFIAREASRMSGPQFRREYDAEWADWSELPVYTFDRAHHVTAEHSELQDALPVEVSCDFNVDPMCWVIGQHKGAHVWDSDEIVIEGQANTRAACAEFMRRFPDPRRHVELYGDASGRARDTRSKVTDYQIIDEMLGGFYESFSMDVPAANPAVTARHDAVNGKLRAADGAITYHIHPRCKWLIADRARVSYKPGTREVDKKNKQRTHASDASDYRIVRLYPVQGMTGQVYAPSFGNEMGEANMQNVQF